MPALASRNISPHLLSHFTRFYLQLLDVFPELRLLALFLHSVYSNGLMTSFIYLRHVALRSKVEPRKDHGQRGSFCVSAAGTDHLQHVQVNNSYSC